MFDGINTVCKDCCFADYHDITQIGCRKGILDRYRSVNSKIHECYDEDAEFYVIEQRACPYSRSHEWYQHNLERLDEVLQQELKLQFHAIIFMDTLDHLDTTIKSLSAPQQQLPPAQITVVREKGNTVKPRDVTDLLQNVTCQWRLENQLITMRREEAIHLMFKFCRYPYYSVFQAGYIVPGDYLQTINSYVIECLGQFATIEPIVHNGYEFNAMTIPESVHMYWYLHGNQDRHMLHNIKDWECQNETKICYTMQELKRHIQVMTQ